MASSGSSGNTYKVQSNGKAPSGLSVGDSVVTGGGTYKITGVNSDGSYKSSLVNASQTTSNYTGSYSSVPSSNTKSSNTQSTISLGGNTSSGSKSSGTSAYSTSDTVSNRYGTSTVSYNGGNSSASTVTGPTTSSGRVVQVQSNGKAPSGLSVGDQVVTGGGTYQITGVNSDGSYQSKLVNANQTTSNYTGSYSTVPSTASTAAAATPTYTPIGTYNDYGVSQDVRNQLQSLSKQYEYYKSMGDMASANAAHNAAEDIRASYGYSGGIDGSQYFPIQREEDTLPQIGLPVYEPQIDELQALYDAAQNRTLAALQTSYDQSRLQLEQEMSNIPSIFQQQANAISAQAAKDRMKYNEYAAYQGLNAGNGSQAQLAMNNQLQANLAANNTAQANAEADAQAKLVALYTNYQNQIAQAIANNEYERAAALMEEYQAQAKSIVDVAQAQANLDITVAGFNRDTNNRNYDRMLAEAEQKAKWGDFSGYLSLGYSQDQVEAMRQVWLAQNPTIAESMGYGNRYYPKSPYAYM